VSGARSATRATPAEAIATAVDDGDEVYLGGFGHLVPYALGHELIRQERRDRGRSRGFDAWRTGDQPSQVRRGETVDVLGRRHEVPDPVRVDVLRERNLHEQGVDGRTVMGVFCQDTKLNVSPYYLTPGFSFGGSCLHKDTRAFAELADSALPLVESIHPANREHTERAVDAVRRFDPETVGIAGVSFKPDTDDMRNSPAVELARRLLDDGYDVYTYDPDVDPAALVGSNRAYVEERLPELATLQMDSLAELVAAVDVVVVGNSDVAFESLREMDVSVFDPVGLFEDRESDGVGYESLCW